MMMHCKKNQNYVNQNAIPCDYNLHENQRRASAQLTASMNHVDDEPGAETLSG
jgi:hypothetical protein